MSSILLSLLTVSRMFTFESCYTPKKKVHSHSAGSKIYSVSGFKEIVFLYSLIV